MIATIIDGKTDAADWFFLIALIIFVVAAVVNWVLTSKGGVVTTLMCLGLAFVSLAWLVL